MEKTRNSSIELLKIIAIIFIVLTHACPFYGAENLISYQNFNLYASNIQDFLLLIFRCFGNFGSILFVICTSYFLVNRKKPLNKVVQICIDTIVISILSLIIFSILGVNIPFGTKIKQFFPITFENNWFITSYILLYLAHPILNKAIEKMDKKESLLLCLFIIVVYYFIQFVLPYKYCYTSLVAFISVYFLTAYIKLYLQNFSKNKKINIIIAITSIVLYVLMLILFNFMASKISILSDKMLRWYNLMNPFMLVFCFSLFNIFSNYNYNNKVINYISSLSLLFYLIHENYIFRMFVRPLFYQKVFLINNNKIMWVLLEAILLLIYGMVLSMLYKATIQKITIKISEFIKKYLSKSIDRVTNVLMKID